MCAGTDGFAVPVGPAVGADVGEIVGEGDAAGDFVGEGDEPVGPGLAAVAPRDAPGAEGSAAVPPPPPHDGNAIAASADERKTTAAKRFRQRIVQRSSVQPTRHFIALTIPLQNLLQIP